MTTNKEIIDDRIVKAMDHAWGFRHSSAWYARPKEQREYETVIVGLVTSWAAIGDTCRKHGREVKSDYVLCQIFVEMGQQIISLLNFDCGRLDCGTVDGTIRDIARNEGFDLDTGEEID